MLSLLEKYKNLTREAYITDFVKNYRRSVSIVCGALLCMFCLYLATPGIIRLVHLIPGNTSLYALSADALLYFIRFAIPTLIINKFLRIGKNKEISFAPSVCKSPILMIITSLGLVYSCSYITEALLSAISFSGIKVSSYTVSLPDGPYEIIISFLSMVILPAILEEMLFRGALLNAFLPYGKNFAIIISALLFSLMHANPHQMLYAFCAGILFAVFACESRSLWLPILAHASVNLFSFITIFSQKLLPVNIHKGIFTAICCIFVIAGVYGMAYLIKTVRSDVSGNGVRFQLSILIKDFFTPAFILYLILALAKTLRWFYI